MHRQKTIVYLPSVPYEFTLYQNPNQILNRFAKKGYKVYYCNPHNKESNKYMKEVENNLIVVYDFFRFIKEYKDILFDIRMVSVPQYVTKYPKPKGKVTLFYLYDDFSHWRSSEKDAFSKSDIVLTTSNVLYDTRKKQYNHPNLHVVKNAVSEYYLKRRSKIPKEFKNLNRPIILYVGAVAKWVDTDLMSKIAEKYTTVFVGRELGKKCPSNVINLGAVHHSRLFNYYASADVGIIPFDTSGVYKDVTKYSNPIKMYEYMGAGIPCVSMSWGETQMFPDIVFPSKTHDEFMYNIEKVLLLNKKEYRKLAKKEASKHTWESRVDDIEQIINNYIKKNKIDIEAEEVKEVKKIKEVKKVKDAKEIKDVKKINEVKEVKKIKEVKKVKENKAHKVENVNFNIISQREKALKNPNTVLHWNHRYATKNWQVNNGIRQSTFFSKLIFNNLPKGIFEDIKNNKLSIADIGCSLGELCNIALSAFSNSDITGYDLSDVAIDICQNTHKDKDITFINGFICHNADVVIMSHILERYHNTRAILLETLKFCNKYCIVLCPYEEEKRHIEHVVRIGKDVFSETMGEFKKVYEKILYTKDSIFWNGTNILVIYQK